MASVFKGADALADYRGRIMFISSVVTIILALPLAVLNVIEGYSALAAAIVAMAGVLLVNAVAIRADRDPVLPMALFLATMLVVLYLSISHRGDYGVFWAFPQVLFMSFALSRRVATVYASILVIAAVSFSFYFLDPGFALRASVSLAGVVVFTNIFLSIIDILQAKLVDQSHKDPLTGALNRRTLMQSLEEAIDRKRRRETPASLLIIDIDHFKSLNDTYGHAAGDDVLRKFVNLIERKDRRLDRLFRLGGEEFLLFLPDTPLQGAEIVAAKLLHLIPDAELIGDGDVTVSIGISELGKGETIENWMSRGDAALYQAKNNGRDRAEIALPWSGGR